MRDNPLLHPAVVAYYKVTAIIRNINAQRSHKLDHFAWYSNDQTNRVISSTIFITREPSIYLDFWHLVLNEYFI